MLETPSRGAQSEHGRTEIREPFDGIGGGREPRTKDLLVHLHAAVLVQACNFGPTTMAEVAELSNRRLAWCTNWYLREEALRPAIAAVVDFQHRQPLSRSWGGGTLSSSDGQRFSVPVRSRSATALPRYFGYGQGVANSVGFCPFAIATPTPAPIREIFYAALASVTERTPRLVTRPPRTTTGRPDDRGRADPAAR